MADGQKEVWVDGKLVGHTINGETMIPIETETEPKPGFTESLGKSLKGVVSGQLKSWKHGGTLNEPGDPRQTLQETFNPFHPAETAGYLVPQPVKDIYGQLKEGNAVGAAGTALGQTAPFATAGLSPETAQSTITAPVRGAVKTTNFATKAVPGVVGAAGGALVGHPVAGYYAGKSLLKGLQIPGERFGLPPIQPLPISEGGTLSRGTTVGAAPSGPVPPPSGAVAHPEVTRPEAVPGKIPGLGVSQGTTVGVNSAGPIKGTLAGKPGIFTRPEATPGFETKLSVGPGAPIPSVAPGSPSMFTRRPAPVTPLRDEQFAAKPYAPDLEEKAFQDMNQENLRRAESTAEKEAAYSIIPEQTSKSQRVFEGQPVTPASLIDLEARKAPVRTTEKGTLTGKQPKRELQQKARQERER